MTGSILTPFTLVAIVIILGCVLAALYFLARRRTPSAKPAPRDGRPPQPRDAPLPRVGFPSPAPGSGLNDGPGRTVLVKPDIPPPMRVPGARPPSRDERPGMEEIEHRRRAANTRLKGERPRPAAGDASEFDAGAGDNRGIGATPAAAEIAGDGAAAERRRRPRGQAAPAPRGGATPAARHQAGRGRRGHDAKADRPGSGRGKDRHPGRTGGGRARACAGT